MATVNPSIIFEQQTLTQEQKDQVLSNIGAMKSFDGVPFTSSDRNKLDGIDSGAEVNAIETVKVNGSALTPDANRAVDITVPEVDTTYNASSLNPQSGTAVAAAIATSGNVPTPQSTDDGKVLKAYEDTSTQQMAYKWDVADSGIPSATSGDDGKVLGVTNEGQTLAWVSQPTVNNSTVSVKIGSASATAVGTMTTNQSAASDIVVPMASATETSGDWTYVDGAMAGTDKKALDAAVTKLGGIEAGAQVNIKPDWDAEAGTDAEILHRPNIPTVNDSTISMKIEGDSNAFDSFTTNASSNDTVEIPLATAPSTGVSGNSGAITAADKAKLNALTTSHLHMLKVVNATVEDPAPYDYWIVDMEKPNQSAASGYDFALESEIKAGLKSGEVYGLYVETCAPSVDDEHASFDVFVMSMAANQDTNSKEGVRLYFYKMLGCGRPLELQVTSIYTPSIYNSGDGDPYPEGRMAIKTFSGTHYKYDAHTLSERGVPASTSSDAGKFLGVKSNGDYDWETVEHVPGITSSDNGKVLTASYSGGVGTAAWAALGSGKKVHRIFYDKNSAESGDTYGYLQDLEGEFDSTTHSYPKVQADDLHDWMVEGQYVVLIIGALSGTPTIDSYQFGECFQPYYIDFGIDTPDEKYVDIEFIGVSVDIHSADNHCVRQAFVSTTSHESPNYARISLDQEDQEPYQEFPLQWDLTYPLTSSDEGKVLRAGWDSSGSGFGTLNWDTANEVPTVGSSDNGKVLKATYSSGVGSYSWETAPSSGEMNVIDTVKVNNIALTPDANKAVNVEVPSIKLEGAASSLTPSSNVVTIPNAIATGETGASNGLMTADDKKTVSQSVIYKANPTSGAEGLLAQRLYVVRSDQEIINIINGGGADGQGTIIFRIG